MSLPYEGWQWWADEGGRGLGVRRVANGAIEFTITGGEPVNVNCTIARFRIEQLKEWLSQKQPTEAKQ